MLRLSVCFGRTQWSSEFTVSYSDNRALNPTDDLRDFQGQLWMQLSPVCWLWIWSPSSVQHHYVRDRIMSPILGSTDWASLPCGLRRSWIVWFWSGGGSIVLLHLSGMPVLLKTHAEPGGSTFSKMVPSTHLIKVLSWHNGIKTILAGPVWHLTRETHLHYCHDICFRNEKQTVVKDVQ